MTFRMYANIDGSGWKMILKTKNKQQLREAIIDTLYLEIPAEVIVKYKKDDTDFLLCSFYNRVAKTESIIYKIDKFKER